MAKRATLSLVLVGLLGFGVSTWAVGSTLSAPNLREIGPPPADLAGAETVSFPSTSGSEIRAWFAPGRAGMPTVVLAHVVRGSRRNMLGRARFLSDAGHAVLLFDAQAHGESHGERITFGYLEARDAAAAVAFARARCPEPVAFLGVSQGGAAALLGEEPLDVAALVIEAVYTTLRVAVENRLVIRLGPAGRWLAPVLMTQIEPRLGIPPTEIAPLVGIRHVRAPLLLLAGERDRRATLEQSRTLFRAAPQPKEMWVIPGAAHQDLHRFVGAPYEERILGFLARAVRDAG